MNHYFGSIVQTSHGTSPQQTAELNSDAAIRCSNKDLIAIGETSHGTSGLFTPIGMIAKKNWEAVPDHFPFVKLDAFQIMPNHIHGILFLNRSERMGWRPNEFKWHPRYYDTIIRNETSLNNIRNYIINNPKRWMEKLE